MAGAAWKCSHIDQTSLRPREQSSQLIVTLAISREEMTGAQRLRVMLAAHGLSDTELGALLRREGLHAAQLDEWRTAAETALEEPSGRREKAAPHPDTARLAAVERELRRKEKALAEAAALLVLKKKVEAYWGDADDTTDPTSDR